MIRRTWRCADDAPFSRRNGRRASVHQPRGSVPEPLNPNVSRLHLRPAARSMELRNVRPARVRLLLRRGWPLCIHEPAGIWSRLLAIPGVRPHQVGDEELVVRFHVRDAEPVFQLLRLYRRRVLADETRQKLQEARRKAANRVQEARTGSGATGGTGTAVQTKGPGKVVPDNGSPGPGVEAPEGVGGRRGSSPRGEPLRPESPPPSRAVYLQVTDDQRDD